MRHRQTKNSLAGRESRVNPMMIFFLTVGVWLSAIVVSPVPAAEATLENGWTNPPNSARLRAYWWWLNGNVTKESITHDLEQMKAKGFGGAVIIDAGGADQWGNAQVRTVRRFSRPNGASFTNTRCARPTALASK